MQQPIFEKKPYTIKVIGIFIMVFSIFVIGINAIGLITLQDLLINEIIDPTSIDRDNSQLKELTYFINHYQYIIASVLVLGTLFFVGGLNLIKYKLWANYLVSAISIVFLIGVWVMIYFMASVVGINEGSLFYKISLLPTTIFWSLPFILLIYFLNKRNVKNQFE